jgi:integrase
MRLDTRYLAFEVFLEMPKNLKTRKAITSRIITQADIENVLAHIKRAKRQGRITERRALEYTAFVVFGAYTGQRTMATMSRLTVGQFRETLANEKPVLQVTAEQDKIRMDHYTPLHPEVVKALEPLLYGKKDNEKIFSYNSMLMWIKREKIALTQTDSHFVLGDLRKFAEQHGDVVGWELSNRAYILTHGVSGVDWKHYKHPLPENVYDVYIQYWASTGFDAF